MPQVPSYSPIPSVSPTKEGTPYLNISTPGAAFGTTIGEAEMGLGKTMEHAGETLANDIIYAQGLRNEADVNQATTDYLVKSGELDNKFRLMQGKDPQTNLQSHVDSLRQLRETTRDSLGNPMAQKMFDRETMRRFGYDVVNASNYAATQMKQYTNQSYEANQLAGLQRAMQDPNNEQYLHEVLQSTIDNEAKLSASNGDPPELTKLKIEAKVGRAVKGVASALAKSNPDGAQRLLEKFKDKIPQTDYLEATETIKTRAIQYHSALDARAATGGGNLIDERKIGAGVKTEQLNPEFRTRASAAIEAAEKATGGRAVIESAFRSTEEQARIYRDYQAGKVGLAAPPGHSLHEQGNAIDLQDGEVLKKLHEWQRSGRLQSEFGVSFLSGRAGEVDPGHLQMAEKSVKVAGPAMATSPEASLPEIMRQGEQLAKQRFPDDPISQERYLEQFQSHVQRNSTLARTQLNQQVKAYRNAIDSVLFNVGEGGRGPTSLDEANKLNPNFQQTWEDAAKLNPTITKHINDTFNYNAKQDVPMTQERFNRWQSMKGLAVTDPDQFLSTSLASLDLPRAQYNELHTKQLSMSKKLQDTSHINSALRTLSPMLNDAGVVPSRTDTAKAATYNGFVGALQARLEAFQEEKKRPANESEVMTMGAELLRATTNNWFFADDRAFEVPNDQAKTITNNFKQRYNRAPNPAEISIIYQRMLKNVPTQQ